MLPLDTQIEVIFIKGERVLKKEMTFGEALKLPKKAGWKHINYQLGKSEFKITE